MNVKFLLCLAPVAIIFIILKMSSVDAKTNAYADVDEREEEYGDRTDYR
jgi:hypothetical protein